MNISQNYEIKIISLTQKISEIFLAYKNISLKEDGLSKQKRTTHIQSFLFNEKLLSSKCAQANSSTEFNKLLNYG